MTGTAAMANNITASGLANGNRVQPSPQTALSFNSYKICDGILRDEDV
jgi:hypothetical protein